MVRRLVALIHQAFSLENLVSNIVFAAITILVGIIVRAVADVPIPYLIAGGLVLFLLLVAGWLQMTKWHLKRAASRAHREETPTTPIFEPRDPANYYTARSDHPGHWAWAVPNHSGDASGHWEWMGPRSLVFSGSSVRHH